ncbi:RrF2 family transcriptional regulator [Peribacillus sp. NPDC096379]|uniref:RrF2 family transcriptional regulator n=1 Tax=Peribacillus sp. NPDC096379 TaxID=3364393 RepID=UPI003826BD2F
MKVNKSIEQGIFVLLILALQKGHVPVKSHILSNILNVSDSYLKKILRKLVVAGLVTSNASKDGGFQLAKSIEKISLFDVYQAIESEGLSFQPTNLARKIFSNETHIQESENKVIRAFSSGMDAFSSNLKELYLSELLEKDSYIIGVIDWDQKTD